MKEPVLVVMAAGMGSRYGGLKQIDPVDDQGHVIIDYSLYDARRAGFKKFVFIIKKQDEKEFKEAIGNRLSNVLDIQYAFQDLQDLPNGYSVPVGRVKPFGTAHAIYSCRNIIDSNFAVINADDYYGKDAFRVMYHHLTHIEDDAKYHYSMVGYNVENTLTENGTVARGVCEVDDTDHLVDITERTSIKQDGDGAAYEDGNQWIHLEKGTVVSMNMWGFTPSILEEIDHGFKTFLDKGLKENPMKCEYFIPSVVSRLLENNEADVRVLYSRDKWYGVTYKEDKPVIVQALKNMRIDNTYPIDLWSKKEILLSEAITSFDFHGVLIDEEPYGSGHINDTYLLTFKIKSMGIIHIILQRMNTDIFKEPEHLMKNILNVTSFLRKEIIKNGGDPDRETLSVITTKDQLPYYKDTSGNYWRGYQFITGASSYDAVEKPEDFYESALAFGKFQSLLADYPADTLYETIPDFHNTRDRFKKFEATLAKNPEGRASSCQEEIDFVLSHKNLSTILEELKLPLRVTHNDTKLNNVMIDDKTGKGICVIDLDTVMPGLAVNDYGDSIRFGANTGLEDEKDLSKISLSLPLFDIYTKGFIEGCQNRLTEAEIDALPYGAMVMTYECGMRFLTDYLDGDHYFKTKYDDHNLVRARTQFALVKDMETKWDEMSAIVKKYK